VAVVSTWPRTTATERAKSVLAKILGGVKKLESAERPRFSGLAIASLYADPQLMSKSGSAVIAAEAALEYGFKDFNGKQPPSFQKQKGSPRPFFTKSSFYSEIRFS
jgi:dehydrogenase/reductase SDR family protein 1